MILFKKHYLIGFCLGIHFTKPPDSSVGKESACNAGGPSSIPGSRRSSGEEVGYPLQYSWASLVAQLVKNLPAMQKTLVGSLGWEDPLEKGKATHSSFPFFQFYWDIILYTFKGYIIMNESESRSVVSDSLWLHGLHSPWNSPGQNIGVVAFPFSRGSSQPRDWTQVCCTAGRFFTSWATREAQEYWSG